MQLHQQFLLITSEVENSVSTQHWPLQHQADIEYISTPHPPSPSPSPVLQLHLLELEVELASATTVDVGKFGDTYEAGPAAQQSAESLEQIKHDDVHVWSSPIAGVASKALLTEVTWPQQVMHTPHVDSICVYMLHHLLQSWSQYAFSLSLVRISFTDNMLHHDSEACVNAFHDC